MDAINRQQPDQQNNEFSFPFTDLPTEIRLTAYRLAIQDILDIIPLPEKAIIISLRPLYLDALALLHTTRNIRQESAREMLPLAESHFKKLESHARSLIDANLSAQIGRRRYIESQEYRNRKRAEMDAHMAGNVRSVLWRAFARANDVA